MAMNYMSNWHLIGHFAVAGVGEHILCTALNFVSLSIGSSVVHSTLFIIGVMENWSDGAKRIF